MVAGGVLNNPLPHAHAITFTTHKTLCGPRGAAIMTTSPELAKKMDTAVFPGLQGGPHVNSIAAIARLFELILEDREGFAAFQRRVVENTRFFADRLAEEGFALEYGGTNTHMTLVDLKKFPAQGETFLDGEIASRLLEIAGIVCNKNVLPGDADASRASGLRFGLPWLTQRGVTREQLREIAAVCKFALSPARTICVWSPSGAKKCRARVPPGVLRAAAERTLAVADALPYPPPADRRPRPRRTSAPRSAAARPCCCAGTRSGWRSASCSPRACRCGRHAGPREDARLGRARDRRRRRAGTLSSRAAGAVAAPAREGTGRRRARVDRGPFGRISALRRPGPPAEGGRADRRRANSTRRSYRRTPRDGSRLFRANRLAT